jgi:hypothetical protein
LDLVLFDRLPIAVVQWQMNLVFPHTTGALDVGRLVITRRVVDYQPAAD